MSLALCASSALTAAPVSAAIEPSTGNHATTVLKGRPTGDEPVSPGVFFRAIDPPSPIISPPPGVQRDYPVSLDLPLLAENPETLIVRLPGAEQDFRDHALRRGNFIPRSGFRYVDDEDPPGTPPIWPDPDLPEDELSYAWSGKGEGWHLSLTVNQGRLHATIANGTEFFQVIRRVSGSYVLSLADLSWYPGCALSDPRLGDAPSLPQRSASEATASDADTPMQIRSQVELLPRHDASIAEGTAPPRVDILAVYTEQGRIDSGGEPSDPSDIADLQVKVLAALDEMNVILGNSLVQARIQRVSFRPLPSTYQLTGEPVLDRDALANLTELADLRDETSSDLVLAVMQNYDPDPKKSLFQYCGFTFVASHPGCDVHAEDGCGTGDLDRDSVALVAASCLNLNYTVAHEFGHTLGGNHMSVDLSTGWRDAVIQNQHPLSFATNHHPVLRTVMFSNQYKDPGRLPYFANPEVQITIPPYSVPFATGDYFESYVASTVEHFMALASELENLDDPIFAGGFE